MNTVPVNSIRVGNRHRRDLGNISELAKSIDAVGLLHPVVVTPDLELIAGERRLSACKELGWDEIPITTVALDEIVRGEHAENAARKPFLPSEIYAIHKAIEPMEKAAAKDRQREHGQTAPGQSRKVSLSDGGQTRDKIGEFAGTSGRTVEKIAKVMEAAEKEPERFGPLVKKMDEKGVDGVYRTVMRDQKHRDVKKKAQDAKIGGMFSLIYADPPWTFVTYSETGQGRGPAQHYPTMSDDEIKKFKVSGRTIPDISFKDAALFMWCTSSNLVRALSVLKSWGFTYKTHAVWDKKRPGTGQIFLNQHEVLLYGSRGSIPAPANIKPSVFSHRKGAHSKKPAEVRAALEDMYPHFNEKTRIELFAREQVPGWTVYGYEAT